MEEHFGQGDCLTRACGNAACSRTTLIRKFQTSLGQTPGRYLWQLRTEKGLGMLRNSGLTVAEIAELCGFSNPFHFSRRVRATTGISPREVRRKAWGY
jgi:AraC-like DNA-binding protein